MSKQGCAVAGFALVAWLAAAGCSEIRYTIGAPPDLGALDSTLKLGQSSPADVRAALGQASGEGVIMLPIDDAPRTMWPYYYEVSRINAGPGGGIDAEMRRTFLFVYFERGRYDGYMWFSSLP